jgi:hypothetical protein
MPDEMHVYRPHGTVLCFSWFHELYQRLRDRVFKYTVNLDGNMCTQAKLQM